MAVRKGHCGCLGELLKINGHNSSLSTTCWGFFPPLFAYAYAYVIDLQQLPKQDYSTQIWHYRSGGNLTIFDKDDDTVERNSLKFLQPSMAVLHDYYGIGSNQSKTGCAYRIWNLAALAKGVVADRKQSCRITSLTECFIICLGTLRIWLTASLLDHLTTNPP